MELSKQMKQKIVFDGRNLYNPVEMEQKHINYFCVGRQGPLDSNP